MADPIVFPGTVEWSGENPGISLKEIAGRTVHDAGEPVSGGAVATRTRPRAGADAIAAGGEPAGGSSNVCLTDNDPLAHWLIERFVTNFRLFKGLPGMQSLAYRRLDTCRFPAIR